MNPVLDAASLSRNLGDGGRVHALRHASLRLFRGEVVAVVGPSGSGKTTLLNVLGLLDRPDTGSIRLCGKEVAAAPESDRAFARLARIGFVFQRHHLIPYLSARENVALPARRLRRDSRRALARADELLEAVGLANHRRTPAGVLSLGEAQRVAVARALVNDPVLVLADEPTGSLDSRSAQRTMDLLTDLARNSTALLVVTHDTAVAAGADRVLEMEDGALRHAAGAERRMAWR